MKQVLLVALVVGPTLGAGCGHCSKCAEPSGPAVDLVAAQADVAGVFGGTFSGLVADGPILGTGSGLEPCAIEGASFEVSLEVGDVYGCDDYRGGDPAEEEADCARARGGYFPWTGQVTVSGEDLYALEGTIVIWSGDDGLWPFNLEISLTPTTFPRENLIPVTEGTKVADTRLLGLEWSLRLSQTENETARWEVCALGFE